MLQNDLYFVAPKPDIYHIPVPYHHWQLRDMLKCAGDKLVCNSYDKIVSIDPISCLTDSLAQNLAYIPTTFDISRRFIALGGSKGEVTIIDLHTGKKTDFETGYTIINSVKIKDGLLYVCSNERKISVINLHKGIITNTFTHSTQINNCDISEDGSCIIACGDSPEILMFSCRNSCLELIQTFKTVNDGGFGVSWNSKGSLFGVGTQDGYVSIFDIRKEENLELIKSHQHPYVTGAVRNLTFTKNGSTDLLVFSEHCSYFTVLDTRDFSRKQLIKIDDNNNPERNITGLTLNGSNDRLFVSTTENIFQYKININLRRMSSFGAIL